VAEVAMRLIGGPTQNYSSDYVELCPKCNTRMNDDDHGYGFAFGGGIGVYISCPNCDWFIKEIDSEES
jgi:hypothetical protein